MRPGMYPVDPTMTVARNPGSIVAAIGTVTSIVWLVARE